jgi:septum formation protein
MINHPRTNPKLRAISGSNVRIILASASITRRRLLENAGVLHTVIPSQVDESDIKANLRIEGASGTRIAEVLAEAKAVSVSQKHPGKIVLGADQVLECEGKTIDKPVDAVDAISQLRTLRGKRHQLISSAAIVREGSCTWRAAERANLEIRGDASDSFFTSYLEAAAEDIYNGPGAYRIESLGAQLFSRVDGSHFAVLGLPMMDLLCYLRREGVLAT